MSEQHRNTPTCPDCGATMVPMKGKMSSRGWNCSLQTWDRKAGRGGCPGVKWNKGSFVQTREKVIRPAKWPGATSKHKRTAEQEELRAFLAMTPAQRGGRLLVVDAVAGSAKSWSMADGGEVIYKRVGPAISDWWQVAFNVNASESLQSKIPAVWPNISTINGFGGRLQGYNFRLYKLRKVGAIFKDMVADMPSKTRPKLGPLAAFAERARDMLVFTDNDGDAGFWSEAIARLSCRFPGLAKRLEKEGGDEVVRGYLAPVMVRSVQDGKVIDLTEQYARPALLAMKSTGWRLPWEMLERGHNWTDNDCEKFAALVRSIKVPQVAGVIVDEAQDLSPSQAALFLAATYRGGELILVGDDRNGAPGDADYKAGQGIFGWRGAGGGWLSLIPRIWKILTGETTARKSLSVTFRVPPSGVEYMRAFCPRMVSSKTERGEVREQIAPATAYQCWLDLPEGDTALWLTRKNAPLGPIFMQTLKDRKRVCLRGSGDFAGKVDAALFDAAGWYDDAGEYRVSLSECCAKLAEAMNEEDGASDDSLAGFLLVVGRAILADSSILTQAQSDGAALQAVASVGNLKRFVTYFASADAPRVCSTVYRAKGDEADLVIVDDCESINSAWNGDSAERNAVAFVAGTRQKKTLLVCGSINGPMSDDEAAQSSQSEYLEFTQAAAAVDNGFGSDNPPPADLFPAVAVKPRTIKPRKVVKGPSLDLTSTSEAAALVERFREAESAGKITEALKLAQQYQTLTGLPIA